MKNKAIILFSGGLDSTTTLYYAIKKGYKCFCLIFDYNQKHRKEILSARKIAEINKCEYKIIKFDLPWTKNFCSLIDKKLNIKQNGKINKNKIPNTYVPARNTIFLSFAISWADVIGADNIFIGANAVDFSGYPDCRPQYFKYIQKVAQTGTKNCLKNRLKIITPLINLKKSEIIKLGIKLGVPFEYTWSCYAGKEKPCNKCDSCILRKKAFEEVGIKDPLLSVSDMSSK